MPQQNIILAEKCLYYGSLILHFLAHVLKTLTLLYFYKKPELMRSGSGRADQAQAKEEEL